MSPEPDVQWLSDFPVDDDTLTRVEEALRTSISFDEDGNRVLVGGDFTLNDLLEFMSGYDATLAIPDGEVNGIECFEYPFPIYHVTDVVRALIDEIRRLRGN